METVSIRSRKDIPDIYKWKLEDMYATDAAWEQEMTLIGELTAAIAARKGSLGQSAADLLAFLKAYDELSYYTDRAYVYACQRYHQDTADSHYQAYADRAETMLVEVGAATAFANPEILAIPEETLESFYAQEGGLELYRRKLSEILRQRSHTLSPAEEAILAEAGQIAGGPADIFNKFNNADIKFPYISDVMGNRTRITHGNFISFLKSPDRSLRKQAFCAVYDSYAKMGNSVAAMYVANLKQDRFFSRMRGYESTRQMKMDGGNIPESVYDNLIEAVHRHLPALHRYVSLRKRLLGVEQLHMYDLYVPIVTDIGKKHDISEAKKMVAWAVEPMGTEYVSQIRAGMDGGWIDVYENENKRTGAYSWGAYGTHPYVLMNYQNDLDSVYTLAHEMGHSMHTWYSNRTQPICYSGYRIFVAEVASTCNECLLMDYLFHHTDEEIEQRYLINHQLEEFRTTVFRQTMFAEFEHIVHKRLADGESLTMKDLNQIYYDLNVLYYGPDMAVDEEIAYEWMRIPHFYESFYVYQYATGFSAAVAFSRMILEEGKPAAERYIREFLCGGCSKDPIDLLKAAGVDMTGPEPVDMALEVFEKYLQLLEDRVLITR